VVEKRKGLGRGLGALIPQAGVSVTPTGPAVDQVQSIPGVSYAELPVVVISPNPKQPRATFDEGAHKELVHSIREIGLLQPVVVRPMGSSGYQLVAGERRLRAAKEAGLSNIPAIVRDTADDNLLRDALLENLHRVQLNPLEEAAAYQQLLEDFGGTQEELANRLGLSRPQVTNTLRLLKLPAGVQRRVAAGVLSAGHAKALLGLSNQALIETLAQRVVSEGLSVRATEEIVGLQSLEPEGDSSNTTTRPSVIKTKDPALEDVANSLEDYLDTKVTVTKSQKKGRITIDFADLADLRRIVNLIRKSG
jgi:ParB family chromosome partitioning protein